MGNRLIQKVGTTLTTYFYIFLCNNFPRTCQATFVFLKYSNSIAKRNRLLLYHLNMKKVIFLCLLSLSVCLSKPAENQAAPSPPAHAVETKTQNATEPAHPTPLATETKPAPNKEQTPPAKSEPEKATPLSPTAATQKETAASPTKETPSKESPKPTEDNKTQNKEEEKKEAPKSKEETAPTKTTNETKVPTEKISTDKPEEGKAKNGTKPETNVTPKPSDTITTEAPKSDKDAHIVQARGFDGPSFIGGIILTLGLLAIGFMGFKYYKNQTERNYHTL